MSSKKEEEFICYMLTIRVNMKIYHWSTKSYSRHKASDDFVSELDELSDSFVETYQGNTGKRINLKTYKNLPLMTNTDQNVVEILEQFKDYLTTKFNEIFDSKYTDLYTIRDEILALTNKTLYLYTFQ